jgi:hypothetical protein
LLDSLLPAAAQLNSLAKATARYEENVEALASFLRARGISREAAIASHLGHVSDPMPGHEKVAGFMSIPYCTGGGVMALKFRCIADHNCKEVGCQRYDQPAGQKVHLFNAGILATTKSDMVAVCEGELDAILCTHELGIPAVGTAAGTWLDHYPRCFADFEEIIVIADHDVKADGSSPGIKHAKKVQSTVSRSRIVMPPPGMDLGDWFLSVGREAVLKGVGL